jgi:hypothetical protein
MLVDNLLYFIYVLNIHIEIMNFYSIEKEKPTDLKRQPRRVNN